MSLKTDLDNLVRNFMTNLTAAIAEANLSEVFAIGIPVAPAEVKTRKTSSKKPANGVSLEDRAGLPIVIFTHSAGDTPNGGLVKIKKMNGKFQAVFQGRTYKATRERDLRRKLQSLGTATSDNMEVLIPSNAEKIGIEATS